MIGRIVQISISRGGVPKTAVAQARVTPVGIEGDAHRDAEHHGGAGDAASDDDDLGAADHLDIAAVTSAVSTSSSKRAGSP